MQIHEVTKLKEQGSLGQMFGDLAYRGLATMMGGGAGTSPENRQAAVKAKVKDVAQKAWPSWVSKKATILDTFGRDADLNEELLKWLEGVVMRGTHGLMLHQLDPRYVTAIQQEIPKVTAIPDSATQKVQQEFEKLITLALTAGPNRNDREAMAAYAKNTPTAQRTGGTIPIQLQGDQIRIGKHVLNPQNREDQIAISYLNNLIDQGKI